MKSAVPAGNRVTAFRFLIVPVLLFLFSLSASAAWAKNRGEIFQISTINALLSGVMDGNIEYSLVEEEGDFGLGTFNALDGEMVAFDGKFYQVKSDGHVYPVAVSMKTPFVTVLHFHADENFQVSQVLDYAAFRTLLDTKLPTKNIAYAVRVEGEFEYVKTRSVPAQKKPYPRLEEVVKTQPVFEFHRVRGTLVGFRFPDYMGGINVPGYHFHFLTADRQAGGHVLDLKVRAVSVAIEGISGFGVHLPESRDFDRADLSADKTALVKAEK